METDHSIQYGEAHPLVARVQGTNEFGRLRSALERAQTEAQTEAQAESRTGASGEERVDHRVHLSGLRGSSPVFLLEAIRERIERPVLIVCPDQEAARDVFSDLGTVSQARALLFPERDIFPQRYETHENLAVRGDRNEALSRIIRGDVDVVVTSLLGFLEKTITVEALRSHRMTVTVDDTIDLEAFREHLVNVGYDAVSVTEEAGQFAVRGSIVDVFDPSWDRPARIELFDEEVISIRTFDLDTQLSVERVESITVLPAASVPFDDESTAVDHLRTYLESAGFASRQIERIGEELLHSRHSYLRRRYAPALGVTGSLLDFFRDPPLLWILQGEAQNRAYKRLREDMGFVAGRPDEEFPLLGLDDYLHPTGYYQRRGVASVVVWDLATATDSYESSRACDPIRSHETVVKFHTTSHPSVVGKLDPLIEQIRKLHATRVSVQIYSETPTQRERIADMLEEDEDLVHLPVGWITSGFVWESAAVAVFTDHQIFNRVLARPRTKQKKRRIQGFRHEHLQLGDFVVHVDYGIGRFVGLEKVRRNRGGEANGRTDGDETECLVIRYLGDDRIYVPLDQMHLVEKYVGKEGIVPSMDRLGGNKWHKTKEKARKAVEDVARDLLAVYAAREVATGHSFSSDTQWQKELEASFPFEETPHQIRATEEIKSEMERDRPMDRLVCGDVGYGKTEVAIRAAFKAAADGKQVAILVPTTLLAFQHFNTLKERMALYPVEIRMLSRFVPKAEQKIVIDGLKDATTDIVVGTHRLLSRDVSFKNLGLLIIDEEHRFGVKHKERLKRLAKAVDVLSLTATPIPRTLYMSLSGLREISIIDTPPRNRHPIKTEVLAFDEEVIQRAISDEIARDGQVFFVHNRVESIYSMQGFLERLLPGVRFCVGHGQMSERELEKVMLAFMDRQYDVLVSTMIIESGLDLPNVNTIIINRSDRFGLAQLYQLRGRVGRREQQAYSYFLIPRQMSLTEGASRRLQAMEEFEELGSGYRLAMRDLEIRGAGNVLGLQQHGHVAAIGFDLYCKMLKEAVEKLRGEEEPPVPECRVESPYSYYLPDTYVEDADERMMIYKRMSRLASIEALQAIESELVDRFGEPPSPVRYLLDLAAVKILAAVQGVALVRFRLDRSARDRARQADKLKRALSGVDRISRGAGADALAGGGDRGTADFEFSPGRSFSPAQCMKLVETFESRLLFKSGRPFAVRLESEPADRLIVDAKNLLQVAYFSNKM
jgi:transcription-repair coupling factor (superfamily II helicase)